MRKKLLVLIILASFVLSACGAEQTQDPVAPAEKVQVRWFVGLGTGTDEPQIAAQEEVVAAFNESHDDIELILEIVPNAQARDTLSTQIAADAGPDIIGPVGIAGSNWFYGQFLDMAPLIESSNYDTTQFEEALVKFFQTEEGQVGLPFAVYPTALFYQKAMFDEAGLNYPPQNIGDKYVMPDGSEVEWSWDTLTEVAKLLTVDSNGLTPLDDGFDRDDIVQVGYAWPHLWPSVMGTFFEPGVPFAGEAGAYTADIPAGWEAGWRWYYEGVYGDEPFIPSGPLAESPEFGSGNVFNGGRSAMAVTQLWYGACCVSDAGDTWDVAAFPSYDGVVHGRLDAGTFRIWKGTANPEAAFEALTYLIGEGVSLLAPAYGALPARESDQAPFWATMAEKHPHVENWDVFVQALAYPDIPSAEAYWPGAPGEVWSRLGTFISLLANDGTVDFDAELAILKADLEVIFNK